MQKFKIQFLKYRQRFRAEQRPIGADAGTSWSDAPCWAHYLLTPYAGRNEMKWNEMPKRTKSKPAMMSEYLAILLSSAADAANPASVLLSWLHDYTRHRPLFHGTCVNPSGRFPTQVHNECGSRVAKVPVLAKTRNSRSGWAGCDDQNPDGKIDRDGRQLQPWLRRRTRGDEQREIRDENLSLIELFHCPFLVPH